MYIILGADQKEYGPVAADEIRRWIQEGRVNGQSKAKPEGSSEWRTLSDFPEFASFLAVPRLPPHQPPLARPAMMSPGSASESPAHSGLAIASLVMGILSFFGCSVFSGIPAIITGHIAHQRARKMPEQYGGKGMAIAGMVMGYISLAFIPLMFALLLPAVSKAKSRAQQINCASNMKQIGLAARIWADGHNGKFPPTFIAMSNELVSARILVCPTDASKTKALTWEEFGSENLSYEYLLPGVAESEAAQTVVFRCPIHQNIGMGDGSVIQGARPTRRLRSNGPPTK